MDMTFIVEAIRFFENIKPAVEGLSATGTVLASTASVTVSVIKNGAKMFSYLIKRPEKKKGKKKTASGSLDITKKDIAIVVDIAQPILENVRIYLEKKKIDADVVLVTNRAKYSDKPLFLNADSEKEWEQVVGDFVDIMYEVRRSSAGCKIHVFSSAPVPVSFAIGAMWGTVQNAILYHWQNDTYNPVIRVRRDIRSD
jgi:NACalpha-BTF3-like transcription factor